MPLPGRESSLATLLSGTLILAFQLLELGEIDVCCLSHGSVVFCYGSPSPTPTECLIQPLYFTGEETEAQGMTLLKFTEQGLEPRPLLPGTVLLVIGLQECELGWDGGAEGERGLLL